MSFCFGYYLYSQIWKYLKPTALIFYVKLACSYFNFLMMCFRRGTIYFNIQILTFVMQQPEYGIYPSLAWDSNNYSEYTLEILKITVRNVQQSEQCLDLSPGLNRRSYSKQVLGIAASNLQQLHVFLLPVAIQQRQEQFYSPLVKIVL